MPASKSPSSVRSSASAGAGWGGCVVRLNHRLVSYQTRFKRATATPTALGQGEWIRRNPLRARLVLVRLADKGRRGNTAFGKRSRSKASTRAPKRPGCWWPASGSPICRQESWCDCVVSPCRSRRAFVTSRANTSVRGWNAATPAGLGASRCGY